MEQRKKGKRFSDGSRGNTRGHTINGAANKDRRRTEAFARELANSKLTTAEKLKRLPPEGATRQRAKLTARLAKEQSAAAQTSQLVKDAKAMVDAGQAVSLSEAKRKLTQQKKDKAKAQPAA